VSQIDRFVARLFEMPGDPDRSAEPLLGRAAKAHRRLLDCAASEQTASRPANRLLPGISALLKRLPDPLLRRRFLVDPAFVEGLHRAIGVSRVLSEWHQRVAQPSIANVGPPATGEATHRLGNSLLTLLLYDNPHWCGQIGLRTDLYGRLRFPLSDWSIALARRGGGPACVLADELIVAQLTRQEVRLSLETQADHGLLTIRRQDWLRMFVANDPAVDGGGIAYLSSDVNTRLQFAGSIPGWQARYEPVSLGETDGHFALTGGIIASVLGAIRRHSRRIADEFDVLMSSVRGWELPARDYGTIQSFSDPTLPRVMSINVPYAADDAPCICPFCFTWFGHELGHTKSYLIETILHVGGQRLCTNAAEYTDVVERYGRALSLRTVLQIPYTHLFEWVLLMDAIEGDFVALPWKVEENPADFSEEIQVEIVEAFERIEREARLTPCGHAAVSQLQELTHRAQARWRTLKHRSSKSSV
jgi:hypothetical protein